MAQHHGHRLPLPLPPPTTTPPPPTPQQQQQQQHGHHHLLNINISSSIGAVNIIVIIITSSMIIIISSIISIRMDVVKKIMFANLNAQGAKRKTHNNIRTILPDLMQQKKNRSEIASGCSRVKHATQVTLTLSGGGTG